MKNSKSMATFFAMLPGAGHMYLGLTKQGIELMMLFFFTIFLSSSIGLEFLGVFLPIIWFYSIFDVRSKAMSEEPLVDSNLKIFSNMKHKEDFLGNRSMEKYIGYFLIIVGILALINNIIVPLASSYIDYSVIRYIKCVGTSVFFIVLGLFLLRKKKVFYLKAGEEKCKEEE
ncbi:hypothetical protein [Clostridium scatologenes]|uniref:TM2 domain-containing protein n=1 Tax=Clostridium scatologenes TaxID=1548 RepID=A0A0E3MC05_CLOSL|nr:hypothetical protein [Clostridium scatologenes]AKA72372.1 hypothetical protein CSCA_5247 [Clostridium scatologenes]